MPLKIDTRLTARKLLPAVERLFDISGQKIVALEKNWNPRQGTPVFTEAGRYTSRGWTEWTQGFQYGSALLQFDVSADPLFLNIGRRGTIERMASHVSHVGVHDHGFNNISTYGNLWRLMREGKIPFDENEKNFLEMALKVSGAIQASRWSETAGGTGYICSFNGPHSLFIDTIRSLRSLVVAHQLGHLLMAEQDRAISLLGRAIEHLRTTIRFNIFFGRNRDAFDEPGRTVHECIFNRNNGEFRCPNSQQGYSPFTTWTRGLAWAVCGLAEQLEFFELQPASVVDPFFPRAKLMALLEEAAMATAQFYLDHSAADGIPLWDTGAPNAYRLKDYLSRPSDPYNRFEPFDSSAATIAAQGFCRLGNYFSNRHKEQARHFQLAGLTIARTLFREPYLSADRRHQGLILHSVYHRPNGWDHVAKGEAIPNGESSMWGDYHARELGLWIWRAAHGEPYPTFFDRDSARS